MGVGKRRMANTQNTRIKSKAKKRVFRTRAMVKRSRAALKIVMPGVAAQQSYGHVVNGASATQTHDMRVNLKGATQFGGTQACITTSLAWLFGPTADSAVKNVYEQLDMWFLTWRDLDASERKETKRAWAIAIGKVLKGGNLKKNKRPVRSNDRCGNALGLEPRGSRSLGDIGHRMG